MFKTIVIFFFFQLFSSINLQFLRLNREGMGSRIYPLCFLYPPQDQTLEIIHLGFQIFSSISTPFPYYYSFEVSVKEDESIKNWSLLRLWKSSLMITGWIGNGVSKQLTGKKDSVQSFCSNMKQHIKNNVFKCSVFQVFGTDIKGHNYACE